MKKYLMAAAAVLLTTTLSFAQNFEPEKSPVDDKLKALINRYGTAERIYLNDASRKTFEARGGQIYLIAFVYASQSKQTMRMMVYEVGPNGEKKNIKYPDFSKGYRGSKGQMFYVRLDPEGDENTVSTYKIDANSDASVYIYKATPGVK